MKYSELKEALNQIERAIKALEDRKKESIKEFENSLVGKVLTINGENITVKNCRYSGLNHGRLGEVAAQINLNLPDCEIVTAEELAQKGL